MKSWTGFSVKAGEEVVAEDRQAEAVHVQAQLVGTPGAGEQAVAGEAVAMLDQFHPGLGIRLAVLLEGAITVRSLTIRLRMSVGSTRSGS